MTRDPHRAIPALDAPTLAELGLADLAKVSPRTRWLFVTRPFAAAALSGWALSGGRTLPALLLVPVWFGWSMTLIHHMVHGALGGPRWLREGALAAASMIILHSGHAIEATHLQHHRPELDAADPEGFIESVPWRRLPLEALLFRYRLWIWGFRAGPARRRRWIAVEAGMQVIALLYCALRPGEPLMVLLATLWLGDVVFAVLLAKGPHTNWGRLPPTPLIAVRTRWARWLMLGQHWHLEHHIYPHVPMPRLTRVEKALGPFLEDQGAVIRRLP